jgi:single-strand DNA-binding protein
MNFATLIGNVGRDPEINTMSSGDMVANFSLATSRRWTDKASGDKKEQTQWHRIVVYGNLVQVVENYVRTGTKLAITGEIQYRKWKDRDDNERTTAEIIVSFDGRLEILSGGVPREDLGEGVSRTRRSARGSEEAAPTRRSARAAQRPAEDDLDLDDEPPFDP